MTKKERILMAMRGETPDVVPYTPRFDPWYNSNAYRGTLPRRHQGLTADKIARAEGGALHKVIAKEKKDASGKVLICGLGKNPAAPISGELSSRG
jgi:hypothetical protein